MSWKKFITYLIPLVVLILYIGFQTDTIDKIKEAVTGTVNISIGEKKLAGAEPTIPENQEKAITSLIAKMEEMRDSPRENCFGYVDFPNLGENIAKVTFNSRNRDGKYFTEAIIYGGAGAKQEVPRLYKEIKDIKPCIIGGSEQITSNFIAFLESQSIPPEPYYAGVKRIDLYSLGDYNHITVPDLTLSKEDENLESSGWLFKGKKGNICFIPTNYYNDDAEGIDNDYFLIKRWSNGINQLLAQGKLNWCGAEGKFRTYDWIEFAAQGDKAAPLTSIPIRARCNKNEDCGTERLNCDEYKDTILKEKKGENCLIIASELDFNPNDCASGEVKTGKVLPVKEVGFFSSSNSIVESTAESTIEGDVQAQSLLKGIFLWHAEKNSLICNNGLWYECNDLSVDQELEIVRAAGPYSDEELFKVRCTTMELSSHSEFYVWEGPEGLMKGDFYPRCPGNCIDLTKWKCKSETFAAYECSGGEGVTCCAPGEAIELEQPVRIQPVIVEPDAIE